MSKNLPKSKYYPIKPKTADGFKKAVAWFGGREMIASLKGILMYAIYGENTDPRSWMKPNIYPNIEDKVKVEEGEKLKGQIAQDVQKSSNEYGQFRSVIETQVNLEVEKSDQIKDIISKKVEQEWADKIFDYWEWKRNNFDFWDKYLEKQAFWKKLKDENKQIDEFWFDFIADSGDGQMGVYGVGCMCFSDLWLDENSLEINFEPPTMKVEEAPEFEEKVLLPRGYFLFIGGDTAYHSANYETLFERFQTPFRWAFASVRQFLTEKPTTENKKYEPNRGLENATFFLKGVETKIFDSTTKQPIDSWDGTICAEIVDKTYWDTEPPRPLFGVPANHDYYDSIGGFNKQFRRSPFENTKENIVYDEGKGSYVLQIPTFSREQEASYVAIHLPFDWWFFGIDSENEKLDFRQEVFFKQIMKEKCPTKMIITTPEPTTVFGKKCNEEDKTATYLKSITESLGLEQPFLADGKFKSNDSKTIPPEQFCRLDLSGDVHHYARYWGANTRELSNENFSAPNYASLVAGGGGAFFDSTSTLIGKPEGIADKTVRGTIPPQKLYPSEQVSIENTADKIFDLRNIKKGGYIQSAGAIGAIITFFFLTQFSNVKEIFLTQTTNVKEISLTEFIKWCQNIDGLQFLLPTLLISVIICLSICGYFVHNLIKNLKELIFKNDPQQFIDGRITQLLKTATPLFVGILIYVVYIFCFQSNIVNSQYKSLTTDPFAEISQIAIPNYFKNLFLLFHFIIAGLLIWLSCEYTNWLAVRFKITRKLNEKTYTQDWENLDEESAKLLHRRIIASILRSFSYKYFAANALIVLAVLVLIFGADRFGKTDFLLLISDLIITLLIVGGLFLYIKVLALNIGAAYQDWKGKIKFLIIGIWHAILQLATPFILFYFANWIVILIIFGLVLVSNGFSKATHYIKKQLDRTKDNSWKVKINNLLEFSLGAEILKLNNKLILTGTWVLFGLIVLFAPFGVKYFYPTMPSLNELVNNEFSPYFAGLIAKWLIVVPTYWIYIALSFSIIAFIGYRLSRVWFSWYLAVSLLFDGHNNEVGGLARIEDFKHLLRIKVEKEKLTVYVIGMDTAQPDISKLKLKLVDKFELKSSPIP